MKAFRNVARCCARAATGDKLRKAKKSSFMARENVLWPKPLRGKSLKGVS
jgi:hypothetical protein